jgi:general secretion pathway protein G
MVMGTLLFGVMSSFNDAKGATTEMAMGKVSSAIQIYTMRHKKPPTSSEGINKVFKHDAIPTDAWGNEFIYSSPGPNGAPFDLLSYGDDGAKGGGDDILWSAVKNR